MDAAGATLWPYQALIVAAAILTAIVLINCLFHTGHYKYLVLNVPDETDYNMLGDHLICGGRNIKKLNLKDTMATFDCDKKLNPEDWNENFNGHQLIIVLELSNRELQFSPTVLNTRIIGKECEGVRVKARSWFDLTQVVAGDPRGIAMLLRQLENKNGRREDCFSSRSPKRDKGDELASYSIENELKKPLLHKQKSDGEEKQEKRPQSGARPTVNCSAAMQATQSDRANDVEKLGSPAHAPGVWNGPVPSAALVPQRRLSEKQDRIQVSSMKGDLTEQTVDVIVNPANQKLKHGGGAAKAIATAAGPQLVEDCKAYVRKHGELKVGQVMHTTAGKLSPPIKHVIHAVGPSASAYPNPSDQKQKLEETFYNALSYANDILGAASIAIPAISSGIFGIPKELVAQAAHSAVKKFKSEDQERKKKKVPTATLR